MFSNIGGKIKVLAKILCWVGIGLSIISGIMILAGGSYVHLNVNGEYTSTSSALVGILTIVFGCLLSWISSFFAYGFGQLIENTDSIRSEMQHKN